MKQKNKSHTGNYYQRMIYSVNRILTSPKGIFFMNLIRILTFITIAIIMFILYNHAHELSNHPCTLCEESYNAICMAKPYLG